MSRGARWAVDRMTDEQLARHLDEMLWQLRYDLEQAALFTQLRHDVRNAQDASRELIERFRQSRLC